MLRQQGQGELCMRVHEVRTRRRRPGRTPNPLCHTVFSSGSSQMTPKQEQKKAALHQRCSRTEHDSQNSILLESMPWPMLKRTLDLESVYTHFCTMYETGAHRTDPTRSQPGPIPRAHTEKPWKPTKMITIILNHISNEHDNNNFNHISSPS